MSNFREHITVFEHEIVRWDKGEKKITQDQCNALERYYGDKGVPFYSLCYKGIQFNEYVGVIQVGSTLIEVLPKADKNKHNETEEKKWRNILIGMLRAVGSFDIKSTSDSHLRVKPNTILDLYFEIFIKEVEYLLNNGLVKKYRKKEENVTALKGCLLFSKNIQQNITHQERFYVRHSTFDTEHKLNIILYKTIRLLKQINTNTSLQSRIGTLLLNFPEMPDIKVIDSTFENLVFNRKTKPYTKAIEIARLILLQYHPDVSKGRNSVLAVMFDMNKLWERFVYVSLRKNNVNYTSITAQTSKYFWKPEIGKRSKIIPDIWIKNGEESIVLDTKWKNLNGSNPSPDDLRQMYVYHKYYNAKKVALVYPGDEYIQKSGHFLNPVSADTESEECSVILLTVEDNIRNWQSAINVKLNHWINTNS